MKKLSHWISGIFSPLLIPTYSYAMALWITPLSATPERARFVSSLVVFFITAAIPLACILMLMRLGYASDIDLQNRRQRSFPFVIATICYLCAALYLKSIHCPLWLCNFFVAAAVSVLIATLITFKWKISAHATGVGGMTGLLLWIGLNGYNTVMILPWVTAAVIISGAVMSARLVLERHTMAQVFSGWALGMLCALSCMFV